MSDYDTIKAARDHAEKARKQAVQARDKLDTLLATMAPPVTSGGWRVSGTAVTLDGVPQQLQGVNFSGFETVGIWNGVWTQNTLAKHVDLMKSIGVNSVRLPLCTDLEGTPDQGMISSANAAFKGLSTWECLDLAVKTFTDAGISVLLDVHTVPTVDGTSTWRAGTPTANNTGGVIDEARWIALGQALAKRYTHRLVIGIDIWNEPHDRARFRPGGPAANEASDPYGDWNYRHWIGEFYAAVAPLAPAWLFVLEGVHENFDGFTVDWQNVYGENLQPLVDPDYRPDLPEDRVLWSPHVYGPDVGGSTWAEKPWFDDPATYGTTLPPIWNVNWGDWARECAVAIGEQGSLMGEGLDKHPAYDNALVDYLIGIGVKNGWYWLWQPNSADTGGLITDENTMALWPEKVELLKRWWA